VLGLQSKLFLGLLTQSVHFSSTAFLGAYRRHFLVGEDVEVERVECGDVRVGQFSRPSVVDRLLSAAAAYPERTSPPIDETERLFQGVLLIPSAAYAASQR